MPDIFDEAQELELIAREKDIAAARALAQPETHPDFDGQHCVDCDDPIHPKRLQLGKVRCVDCQYVLER